VSFARPPADEEFDAVMHTNVLGPMRLAPMLGALLEARGGTLAILSSRMGSIASTTSSQGMLYRVSKAAVNMVARLAHLELAPRSVRVLAFHPGWVRTDMGGTGADLPVDESVAGMRRVIDDATTWPGGSLINHDGAALPW
jgi:NAD(P)-dependent dehydrogenase (short-subunit alcohol dehydrogenase family)